MYSNNFTCKYVYANTLTSPFNTDTETIKVKLPPNSIRSPNMKIQLIAGTYIIDVETNGIVLKMDNTPDNYYSSDYKGACIGILDVTYARSGGGFYHYNLTSTIEQPEYIISSSTQEITISFENTAGGAFVLPPISYSYIFKLSYPVQDEIQNQFTSQINSGF